MVSEGLLWYRNRRAMHTSQERTPTSKLQLFSRSYPPANRKTMIYVVDPMKPTTEETEDKRKGSQLLIVEGR